MDLIQTAELAEAIAERICWAMEYGSNEMLTIRDIVSDELSEVL